jgi:hypothetical protein
MHDWRAQSYQAAWFLDQPPVDIAAIFVAIVGAGPDQVQQPSLANSLAMGTDGHIDRRLVRQPGRLDYFESLVPTAEINFPLFSPEAGLNAFLDRVLRADHLMGNTSRLAVVTKLLEPAPDLNSATGLAAALAKVSIPFDDAEDFYFQVARKRTFPSCPELKMNRVLKWTAQEIQIIGVTSAGHPLNARGDFGTIEIDVNSVPGAGLSSSARKPIWADIRQETIRLCRSPTIDTLSSET